MMPWLYALTLNQPMSSPKMKRMFGLRFCFCCCCAMRVSFVCSVLCGLLGGLASAMRENFLPVVLHADHRPAVLPGKIDRLLRAGPVGELALPVVMVHEEAERRA